MERVGNDFATTLTGAITTVGQTAITVASGTGAPAASFRARIDDEIVLVTSTGAGTNWTIERGQEGTTAATHLNFADVVHVFSAGGLEAYGDENFVSFFPGAATGKVRLVPAGHQFNVHEELVIEGELVVEGEVNIL